MRNRKQKSAELHEENQRHLEYLYSLEYALENIGSKGEVADIKAEMKQMGLIASSSKDKMKREFSHQFDMNFTGCQPTGYIQYVYSDFNETVQMQLLNRCNAPVFIVFPQEHTQSCRDIRRRGHFFCDIQARRIIQRHDEMMNTCFIKYTKIKRTAVQLINFGYLSSL